MRVLFCGTSSSGNGFNPDRAGASLFVEEGATGVLLDCAPAALNGSLLGAEDSANRCSVPQPHPSRSHGVAADVGALAAAAGVTTLVLTALGDVETDETMLPEVRKNFDGHVVVAYDVLEIDVPSRENR